MAEPSLGDRYSYVGEHGLAVTAAGGELSAEMRELDMRPGTEVEVDEIVPADVTGAHDDSEDAVVVAWTDRSGNQRRSSIGVRHFADAFERVDSTAAAE